MIGVLAFILLSLYGFIRSDVGFRILRASQRSRKRDAPAGADGVTAARSG